MKRKLNHVFDLLLSLRVKVFVGLFLLQTVTFLSLGYLIFEVTYQEYFRKFQSHLLSVARICAQSIDASTHQQFHTESAVAHPEYAKYQRFLNKTWGSEKFISYIYTVNYNKDTDTLRYAVDGTTFDTDTVWIESPIVSFYVDMEQDAILVHFASEVFTKDFTAKTSEGLIQVQINQEKSRQSISVDGRTILVVASVRPLQILTPKNATVNSQTTSVHEIMTYRGKEYPIQISFAPKGTATSMPGSEYGGDAEDVREMKGHLKKGEDYVESKIRKSSYGDGLTAYAMIGRTDSPVQGAVIVEAYTREMAAFTDGIRRTTLFVFIATCVFTFLMSLVFARLILRPIRVLAEGVNELSAGNLETNIQLPRRDEFGNLATSFNHMVKQVKRASDETLAVNAELNSTVTSYSKFVPHNFLQFLGHGRITDVKLGDQVQKEMCVLFTDIRSFTTLSEHMTPKENFDFINGYLGRVGPLVRKHHGFIDKYIGDAIMALFPGSAEDAVLAAIEIQQEIFVYNSHRVTTGKAPISVGVGVHFGNLMLGTVGEAERMEGTVISDAVNTASRLEGLTKTFGASIIVSDSVVKALKNPDYFQMRNLGRIKVKGKNQPLIIYEILDGGDSLQISRKLASRKVFERGLDHYYKMEFAEAAASFQRILEKIGSDAAALYYRKQSDHYRESGVPEDWAGVEIMDQKK